LLLVQPGALATRDPLLNRLEQLLIVERLGEELDRARLHGANGHRDIAASGDEYDRQFEAEFAQFLLQLEPAEIREVNVKHQTVSILQAIVTQHSAAVPNVSTCKPAVRINRDRATQTVTSSSTTNTFAGRAFIYLRWRQPERRSEQSCQNPGSQSPRAGPHMLRRYRGKSPGPCPSHRAL